MPLDYKITSRVDTCGIYSLFKGESTDETSRLLLIETLSVSPLSPSEEALFKNKISVLIESAPADCLRALDYHSEAERISIIYEAPSGVTLNESRPHPLPLVEAAHTMIIILKALGAMHARSLIHGSLSPYNIYAHSAENRVMLKGSAFSVLHNTRILNTGGEYALSRVLPFVAPEQTGRLRLSADARADIYSAGAILYYLVVGKPPFSSEDPAELIYSHIARTPAAFSSDGAGVMVSAVISKALMKNPDDRYQSCGGMIRDLEMVIDADVSGSIPVSFSPGTGDFPLEINPPRKIYGREAELLELNRALSDTGSGIPLVVISGPPGIGKSSLVSEFVSNAGSDRLRLLSGRSMQYGGDLPWAPLIGALSSLAGQLLYERPELSEKIKKSFSEIQGVSPGLLTGIVPGLKNVLGTDQSEAAGSPSETWAILNRTLAAFLSCLAESDRAVILFLDDLQWADPETIQLISILTGVKTAGRIYLLIAFRDTEIGPAHPLTGALNRIINEGKTVIPIEMPPLKIDGITLLVSETLRRPINACAPLASIIGKKAAGNPFFIIRYLLDLKIKGVLKVDPDSGWVWNLHEAARSPALIDHDAPVSRLIDSLDDTAKRVLSAASCLGDTVEPGLLTQTSGMNFSQVASALMKAQSEKLIYFDDEGISFTHDRVREAACSLMSNEERQRVHYAAAVWLIDRGPPVRSSDLFTLADHFNFAGSLIESHDMRLKAAEVNLEAATRARASSAYRTALTYAIEGMAHLSFQAGRSSAGTAFSLQKIRLECEYHTGNFSEAEILFSELIDQAPSFAEKAYLFDLMISLQTHQEKLTDAITTGISALKEAGVNLNQKPPLSVVISELRSLRVSLTGTRIKKLHHKKDVEDPGIRAVIKLLTALIIPSYYADPNLMAISVSKAARLCIKHGHTHESPMIFVCAGLVLASRLGNSAMAYEFGELAVTLCDRYNEPLITNRTYYLFAAMIQHLRRPIKESSNLFRNSIDQAMRAADTQFAGRSMNTLAAYRFIAGENINRIIDEYASFEEFISLTNEPYIMNYYNDNMSMFRALAGPENITDTIIRVFNSPERIRDIDARGNLTEKFHFYFNRMRLNFFAGRYKECIDDGTLISDCLPAGALHKQEYMFIRILADSSIASLTSSNRAGIIRKLESALKKIRYMERDNPSLWSGRALLIRAEIARQKNDYAGAVSLYGKAADHFTEEGCFSLAGKACESAAETYTLTEDENRRVMMLLTARHHYLKWGAFSKARYLERSIPEVFNAAGFQGSGEVSAVSLEPDYGVLDIKALMKAIHSLSGRIELQSLTEEIIRIMVTNAGATSAVIALFNEESPVLCAGGSAEQGSGYLIRNPASIDSIPDHVIHYVKTTGQPLISDVTRDGKLLQVAENSVEAGLSTLLCVPLFYDERFRGVIYLENSLTPGAFTPDRSVLVKTLSTQIAIALENAVLFDKIRQAENDLAVQYEEIQAQYEEMESLNEELAHSQNEIIIVNESLKKEGELLLTTLKSISDGVIVCSVEGMIEMMNPAAEELLGLDGAVYADSAVSLMSVLSIASEKGESRYTEWIEPLFTGHSRIDTGREAYLIRQGVGPVPVSVKGAPLHVRQGGFFGVSGAVLVIRDLSSEKEADEKLLRASKIESLGIFAGGIAHDFNNILTGITGSLSLYRQMNTPQLAAGDADSLLEAAERGALRARELTAQLSAFARGGDPVKRSTSIMDLIQETAGFALSGSKVTCSYHEGPGLRNADVDPDQISRVLHNLVINARQAMPAGGSISISAENLPDSAIPSALNKEQHYLVLIISDTGPGIPPEMISRIFDPYFTTKTEGRGLGLAVSYSIVKRHGGEMTVDAPPGGGTSFRILLPASDKEARSLPEKPGGPVFIKGSALVMDDDKAVLATATALLTHLGMTVQGASHGEEALALYREFKQAGNPFDLVIMDLTVPGKMGGAEAVKKLHETDPEARAVVSSGYSDDPVLSDYASYGFIDIITKPYTVEEMKDMLLRVLR